MNHDVASHIAIDFGHAVTRMSDGLEGLRFGAGVFIAT
jgi:hypothetical protein